MKMKKSNLWLLALCILVMSTTTILSTAVSAATPTPVIYTLTVTPVNIGKATIDIVPPGTAIKTATTLSYPAGTVVTLTANNYIVQPETTGWMFQSWSGDVTGSARTITITMDGNKSVTAQYGVIAIDWWTPTPTGRRITPTPTRPRVTPTLRPTPTPTARPTGTPGPGDYVVNYTIQSDWGNGATISVTIKNNSASAVNGWTLAWTFSGNQTIANLWNGSFTQSGANVSVKDGGHNANIPAGGGTANFGFNLNYSGTNAKPTSFTLNGTPCIIQ